jgi:hypothetical protein
MGYVSCWSPSGTHRGIFGHPLDYISSILLTSYGLGFAQINFSLNSFAIRQLVRPQLVNFILYAIRVASILFLLIFFDSQVGLAFSRGQLCSAWLITRENVVLWLRGSGLCDWKLGCVCGASTKLIVIITEPPKLWWPTCTCHCHNDLWQPYLCFS